MESEVDQGLRAIFLCGGVEHVFPGECWCLERSHSSYRLLRYLGLSLSL